MESRTGAKVSSTLKNEQKGLDEVQKAFAEATAYVAKVETKI